MRYVLASKLFMAGFDKAITRAIAMSGDNAIELEVNVELYSVTTEIDVTIEIGNDLANWKTFATAAITSLGPTLVKTTGIASRYVRVTFYVDGEFFDKAILSSQLETSRL